MMREKITSRKNPLLQHVRKLLTSRSYREKSGEYAADGVKLLAEAIKWTPETLRTVLVTASVQVDDLPEQVRLVEIPDDVMEQISPMETPQGALFTCALPVQMDFVPDDRMLVLDGIQDPGNLGTIIRTADALEIPVVLTPGCADAYNPKTVRATMGAVFRCPVWVCDVPHLRALLTASGLPLYGAALRAETIDARTADYSRCAILARRRISSMRMQVRSC